MTNYWFQMSCCFQTKNTPLDEAIQGDNPEIVRLLMKAVASVNSKVMVRYTYVLQHMYMCHHIV